MTDFIAWWNAERLMTIATVVAGVAAVLAWITAIGANRRAKKANEIAQKAIKEAETANQLSAESNVISKDSNRIAVDANEVSKSAYAIQELEAARNAERNDVLWEYEWGEHGNFHVRNKGQDPAFKVAVHVEFDIFFRAESAQVVEPYGQIVVAIPEMYTKAMKDIRAKNERRRNQINAGFFIGSSAPITYASEVRVNWETKLGKHSVHKDVEPFNTVEGIIGTQG